MLNKLLNVMQAAKVIRKPRRMFVLIPHQLATSSRKMATEFAGDDHAALYVKFREKANPQVIDKVMEFLKEKTRPPYTSAIDVACGSGQTTHVLGEHFKTVLGIDISEAQVKEASRMNTAANIKYVVADAEHIPAADDSVDLVTCSQAAHWLDFPSVCKEADRVLIPSGILAVFSRDHISEKLLHQNEKVTKKLNEIILDCKKKTLGPYWKSSEYWNGYVDLNIPYSGFQRFVLQEYRDVSLSTLNGRVSTLSAYQKFHKEHPDEDILTVLQERILDTLKVDTSPDDTIIKTVCQIHVLLGRKPQVIGDNTTIATMGN